MAAIVPTPGVVYKFVFDSGYDCYNGTYRLVKLMTYDEYLNDDGIHPNMTGAYAYATMIRQAVCGQ